jgi:hypothetical protein
MSRQIMPLSCLLIAVLVSVSGNMPRLAGSGEEEVRRTYKRERQDRLNVVFSSPSSHWHIEDLSVAYIQLQKRNNHHERPHLHLARPWRHRTTVPRSTCSVEVMPD